MRQLFSLFLIVLIYGCSTSETIIKPKEIKIEIPAITVPSDSFKVIVSDSFDIKDIPIINGDGVKVIPEENYEATFPIPNSKERARVKVYPKQKKAELYLGKQEVFKTVQETTKTVIKKQTTTPEKFGYAMYGIIGAIILIIIGWLAWRKYAKI